MMLLQIKTADQNHLFPTAVAIKSPFLCYRNVLSWLKKKRATLSHFRAERAKFIWRRQVKLKQTLLTRLGVSSTWVLVQLRTEQGSWLGNPVAQPSDPSDLLQAWRLHFWDQSHFTSRSKHLALTLRYARKCFSVLAFLVFVHIKSLGHKKQRSEVFQGPQLTIFWKIASPRFLTQGPTLLCSAQNISTGSAIQSLDY